MSNDIWHQPDLRPIFNDAEFYENGPVVTINGITVSSDGERDWEYITADGDIRIIGYVLDESEVGYPMEFIAINQIL